MLHELAEEKFPGTDGCVDVPSRPGLGVTVREEFVKKNAVT